MPPSRRVGGGWSGRGGGGAGVGPDGCAAMGISGGGEKTWRAVRGVGNENQPSQRDQPRRGSARTRSSPNEWAENAPRPKRTYGLSRTARGTRNEAGMVTARRINDRIANRPLASSWHGGPAPSRKTDEHGARHATAPPAGGRRRGRAADRRRGRRPRGVPVRGRGGRAGRGPAGGDSAGCVPGVGGGRVAARRRGRVLAPGR